ncbi:MAG: chromosome partitioning ATPase [Pseudomonadota bacterium]
MGLIEKAVGELSLTPSKPVKAARVDAIATPARQFDIDFKALVAQGFYVPTARSTPLALELRAIKRRLLRRTGFLNRTADQRVLRQTGRHRNLIMVCSTRPSEGKTFTSINLALSLACEEEIDVLLVDADTPRPKLRAHFGIEETPGLTDCIVDPSLNAEALALRANQAPLSLLTEGSQVDRTGDLFASSDAQQLFTNLSSFRHDRIVVIDAPPVLATTEAVILARHVDEIVFVVEADSTPEPAVAAALDELLEVNPNVSLILNRCLLAGSRSHYGSYERYEKTPAPLSGRPEKTPAFGDKGTK